MKQRLTQQTENSVLFFILFLNTSLLIVTSILAGYFGRSLTEVVSFQTADGPWMPVDQLPAPMVGIHHFGDYKIWLGYGLLANPYVDITYPAQSLPLLFWIFKLLANFAFGDLIQVPKFLLLYVAVNLVALIYILQSIKRFNAKTSIYFSLLIAITSGPFITVIDRGSIQLIAFAVALAYFLSAISEKTLRGILFLTLAAAIKPYLIVLPLFRGRTEVGRTISEILIASALNASTFLLLSKPRSSIAGFYQGLLNNESGIADWYLSHSWSVPAAFHRSAISTLISNNFGISSENLLRGVALIFGILIWRKICRAQNLINLVYVMAFTTFALPLSGRYNLVWIGFCLPLLVQQVLESGKSAKRLPLALMTAAFVILQAPFPTSPSWESPIFLFCKDLGVALLVLSLLLPITVPPLMASRKAKPQTY